MKRLPGVFEAKKKDGSLYYRASITFRSKHISLGSFPTESQAGQAYKEAKLLLENPDILTPDDYPTDSHAALSFAKWISLINFKNNGFYIKTPIYLQSNFNGICFQFCFIANRPFFSKYRCCMSHFLPQFFCNMWCKWCK